MTKELSFLIDTVKNASKLITDEFEVRAKGNFGDLVTNFDFEIERFIIDRIKENYPDFTIISEEYNSGVGLTDNCFTIDPIDGTINFAHRIPLWGIQVACIKDGETCAAVIYLPRFDELYYADENGAFLNGNPIHVCDEQVEKGLYTIEGSKEVINKIKLNLSNRSYREFHSTAVDFAYVASGRLCATALAFDSYWDYIPGEYIVKQAGGVIYDGDKLHISANNKDFLETLLDIISNDNAS